MLARQIISRECPHRSERSEPFTMLTADMKNKHSLEEALQLYVSGEVLAGDNKYHCRCVYRAQRSGIGSHVVVRHRIDSETPGYKICRGLAPHSPLFPLFALQ